MNSNTSNTVKVFFLKASMLFYVGLFVCLNKGREIEEQIKTQG